MKKRLEWYELSFIRVIRLLSIFLGVLLGLVIIYFLVAGIIWPEIKQVRHGFARQVESQESLLEEKHYLQAKNRLETELANRRNLYSGNVLLAQMQTRDSSRINCNNMLSFRDKSWGLAFNYPAHYVVDYGDLSSPTLLSKKLNNQYIRIYNPILSDPYETSKYHSQSIEDYVNQANSGNSQLYLTYTDLITKYILPDKVIYELRQQHFSPIYLDKPLEHQTLFRLGESDTRYVEFDNNHCKLSIAYTRTNDVPDQEFFCTINSTRVLCK